MRELWGTDGTPMEFAGGEMRLLRSVTDLKSWIAKGSWSALAAAFTVGASMNVAWAAGPSATDQELPDLGSPATAAVSLEEEYQVGRMWARQMRAHGLVIEDPDVSDYIQEIGHSLSSHAEEGQHQFNYFVVRDPGHQRLCDAGRIHRHQ